MKTTQHPLSHSDCFTPQSGRVQESGRVVAVEPDCLWVETIRQSTCNSCAAQKGCGHGLMNKIASGQRHHVRVLLNNEQRQQSFSVNDQVTIAIPERALVQGALIVYLLPLLFLLTGALLASQWWKGDVAAFVGALTGFAVGVAAVKLHAIKNQNNKSFQPVLIDYTRQSSEVIHCV